MEVKINEVNSQEKELEITVPWQMVEDEYKDILKKYSKASIKGFRPGKTPAGVIESFFKTEIKDELLSLTSTRLCRKALKDLDVEAGSPIEISDAELIKNKSLRFKANFIEMPQFELPDYSNLQLESEEQEDKLNEISLKLLEQTTLDLHSTFIDNEIKYSENPDFSSEEEKEAAADRVKLMLILKKIANQDSIEVDAKDIDQRIKLIAHENDVTYDELKEFLYENNGLTRLADSLLAESVLNYIIDIQSPS